MVDLTLVGTLAESPTVFYVALGPAVALVLAGGVAALLRRRRRGRSRAAARGEDVNDA